MRRSCGEGHFVGEIEAREGTASCDGNALHYNGEVGLERAGAVDSAGKNDEARRTSAQNKHIMRSIKIQEGEGRIALPRPPASPSFGTYTSAPVFNLIPRVPFASFTLLNI